MDLVKVVIPAAGLDAAFLPFTKVIPKAMLPILEKPALQYIVEEAIGSEVTNVLMVAGKGRQLINEFFEKCFMLDAFLPSDRRQVLASINKILESVEFSYLGQHEPLGSGHAVWLARHAIHKENFGVMMPDDIIVSKVPALAQLLKIARQEKGSVIAVQEVPSSCISNYGAVKVRKQITPNLFQLSGIVEKPKPKDAPSNLAVVGRYILSSKIFQVLDDAIRFEGRFDLTSAIDQMIRAGEKVFAYKINGLRFDIGTPAGWIKANLGLALQDPRLGEQVRQFVQELDSPNSFVYKSAKALEQQL